VDDAAAFTKRGGPPGTPRTGPTPARVVRVEGDLLVVDFECPRDGFLLPPAGEAVEVQLDGWTIALAAVDDRISTRPGPHQRGLTLRLGLRYERGAAWLEGPLGLRWESPDGTEHVLAVEVRSQSSP
jgi:hypothetical protein